ncbi:MAG: ABC transporter ATP-binding protein [Acidimicrobiales bacterium]
MSKSFGDVTAVDDVSLTVPVGHIVGLLGHNGAGKTTIIRLIAGLLTPDAGRIRVFGLDPGTDGTAIRQRLGVLPSSPLADVRLTGEENMQFAARLFGVPEDVAGDRGAYLLERFGLRDRAGDLVDEYSAGMKQRLSLARVLLPEPQLLLLDEPTAAMDPVGAREFLDTLAEFAAVEQRAILLCTHDLPEAASLCSDVHVLSEGSVIAQGSPAELTRTIDVPTAFRVAPDDGDSALRVISGADPSAELARPGEILAPCLANESIPSVVERLVHGGVRVFGIEQQSATLEDVYFELHRPRLVKGDKS